MNKKSGRSYKIKQHKETIGYGLSMAVLFFLFRWLELKFLIVSNRFEIYVGIIAVIFTFLGIWMSQKLTRPKIQAVIIEKEKIPFIADKQEIDNRKISKRELEVLELIASGMSNNEIAEKLFVSLNTVKSHSSNLFEKLEVKRRTQAVEIAKKLKLLP